MKLTLWDGLPSVLDLPGWFRAVFSSRKHPVLQFIRYGIAGVGAMVTNLGVFILSEQVLFPVPAGDAPVELPWFQPLELFRALKDDLRVMRFFQSNALAFLAANTVAYVLNFLWVFESGKHSKHVEVALFFLVSFVSFLLGTFLASVFIHQGVHPYLAKGADVITAILVNYACRKWLIFKG